MKTTCRFCKGEFVVEYVGELITEKQGVEREESFVFHFKHRGKSWCVDATEESGRLGRLINHSKTNVNVAAETWKVEDVPHIIFRALCDIDEGAELLYDYGDRHIQRRKAHLFFMYPTNAHIHCMLVNLNNFA